MSLHNTIFKSHDNYMAYFMELILMPNNKVNIYLYGNI